MHAAEPFGWTRLLQLRNAMEHGMHQNYIGIESVNPRREDHVAGSLVSPARTPIHQKPDKKL
jgi:hypothetical protein